ncbi:hypothetical protein N7536_002137 [Penicillium majusculum]|nr:hypothetical protein N7536_002137 [Penicillium majusculum]
MYQIIVEYRESVLGLEYPDTLTSVSNLGLVLDRQGRYEEAEAMHRRALERSEKVLGPEHPDTLISFWIARAGTKMPKPYTGGRWKGMRMCWDQNIHTRSPASATLVQS